VPRTELASGQEVEELLGELAEVLQQAGREHHKTLQALTLPVLSAARAAVAVDHLTQLGVPGEHVSAVGMSQYRPLVAEQVPEAERRNRRLEITLVAQH
jgi:hypothetical protein